MRKTMLAILIIGASVLTGTAFAQVNLGGTARVGGGVNAGTAAPSAMNTTHRVGAQTGETLQHTSHKAKQVTHKTADQAHSAVSNTDRTNASVNGGAAMSAGTGNRNASANARVDTRANVDAGAATNRVGQAGQSLGNQAGNTVHSTLRTTGNTAHSVGNTAGQSVGADANVNANADAHGH